MKFSLTVAVLLATVARPGPGPKAIVFESASAKKVLLTDSRENSELLKSLVPVLVQPSDTSGRPWIGVGLFYAGTAGLVAAPLGSISIAGADEQARYYPVDHGRAALWISHFTLNGGAVRRPGRVTEPGLKILSKHGLPALRK